MVFDTGETPNYVSRGTVLYGFFPVMFGNALHTGDAKYLYPAEMRLARASRYSDRHPLMCLNKWRS